MPPDATAESAGRRRARPPRSRLRGTAGAAAPLLLASLAVAGCGSPPSEGPGEMEVRELTSPAEAGSGQPHLSSLGDTILLSWLQRYDDGSHALHLSSFVGGSWSDPVTVTRRSDLFVNWADFPSVAPDERGRLWAHWLERGPAGGYDYGVRVVVSEDGGATWSPPLTPHGDGTPQEHGFVSFIPSGDVVGVLWLDGRAYERGPGGGPPTEEMALRFRRLSVDADGHPRPAGPEEVVDTRTCDCCQTAAVSTPGGAVAFFRDRSPGEIRDIAVARRVDGAWTAPAPVAEDGWHIEGCPVNGPAAVAWGDTVAVGWFTGADGRPRVRAAFSLDGGATFSPPIAIDDGAPLGRVHLLPDGRGGALVSWLERSGNDGAELRLRRVRPGSARSESWTVAPSSTARASGFPRMARLDPAAVVVAWTDVDDGDETRVRVARVEVPTP